MRRLRKRKRQLLFAAIASVVCGTVAIAGIIFFILKLWYFPMALCIAITANGFYGSPFYFIAYSKAKRAEMILMGIKGGEHDIKKLAESAGVSEKFAKDLLGKCIEKGYVRCLSDQENNQK